MTGDGFVIEKEKIKEQENWFLAKQGRLSIYIELEDYQFL